MVHLQFKCIRFKLKTLEKISNSIFKSNYTLAGCKAAPKGDGINVEFEK